MAGNTLKLQYKQKIANLLSKYRGVFQRNQIQVLCSISLVIFSYYCLFHQWIYILVTKWIAADYSYCFLIPFISAYIAWEIRKKSTHHITYDSPLVGYIFLLIATIFFLIGKLSSLGTFIHISMWLSIVGCTGVFFGKQALLRYWFPLFILAFIVPPPAFITKLMSFKLRLISTKIATYVLQLIGIPCYREGNIIDLGITKLQVVHACSGLRYVIPLIIISLVIGYLYRRNFLKNFILFILAIPVAIIGNAMRLVLLAVCSVYISLAVVKNQLLHDLIGWIVFIISVGIIFGINRILPKNFKKESSIPQHQIYFCTSNKKPNILLHSIIITGLFVFLYFAQHILFSQQTVPYRQSFDSFPMRIGNWIGRREFLSKKILNSLRPDDYISATYYNIKTEDKLHLLILYYRKQTALYTPHAPLLCLLGSGFELISKKVLDSDKDTGRWFPVCQLVLKKEDLIVISNFWFDQRGRIITNEYLSKIYLFWDAIKMRRTDGALIRVDMPLIGNQNINKAQKELNKFLVLLKNILNNNYIPQ